MAFTLRDVLVSPKEKTAVVTAVFFAPIKRHCRVILRIIE